MDTSSAEATRQANTAASLKAATERRNQNDRLDKANQTRDAEDSRVAKDMAMESQREYEARKSIVQSEA